MRAVGYFRETAATKGETIGRQNRRLLDFCEAQGYEVATTFAEEAKTNNGAAFAQLIDYLKKPEKGFITVVAPSPQALADDSVVAAARCMQIERLGASVNFMGGDNASNGDALGAMVQNWSAGRDDATREKMRAPCAQSRPRRGAGPSPTLPRRPAQPPGPSRTKRCGALHLSPYLHEARVV